MAKFNIRKQSLNDRILVCNARFCLEFNSIRHFVNDIPPIGSFV